MITNIVLPRSDSWKKYVCVTASRSGQVAQTEKNASDFLWNILGKMKLKALQFIIFLEMLLDLVYCKNKQKLLFVCETNQIMKGDVQSAAALPPGTRSFCWAFFN